MYKGLSNEEVIKSRKKYGSNEIKGSKKESFIFGWVFVCPYRCKNNKKIGGK